MPKVRLPKNARNYAKWQVQQDRGPVKAFFHITKNENIPAIEQQGLLTNHPDANVNSAYQPFRKHGHKGGGVWVTTEPLAFPVYGTTIGGKYGNAAARADALSTIKIEVPVSELPTMRAVQDPYGKNILRKGNDPAAVEPFDTWAGVDVPTTVFLDDMKPEWLKNLGYVEETLGSGNSATFPEFAEVSASWGLPPKLVDNTVRSLSKGDFKEFTGYTGHRHGMSDYNKSQRRFVDDYLNHNQPLAARLGKVPETTSDAAKNKRFFTNQQRQRGDVMWYEPRGVQGKRYGLLPTANEWSREYQAYVKPSEDITKARNRNFGPGTISRGIGGRGLPQINKRHFNWDQYNRAIEEGYTPAVAAASAFPEYALDWDNIVFYGENGYGPRIATPQNYPANFGAISRGSNEAYLYDAGGETILNGDESLQQIKRLSKDKEYRRDLRDALAEQQVIRDGKTTLKKRASWKDILRAWIDYRLDPNI